MKMLQPLNLMSLYEQNELMIKLDLKQEKLSLDILQLAELMITLDNLNLEHRFEVFKQFVSEREHGIHMLAIKMQDWRRKQFSAEYVKEMTNKDILDRQTVYIDSFIKLIHENLHVQNKYFSGFVKIEPV